MQVPYGQLPIFPGSILPANVVFPVERHDVGVRVPNGDWIAADRRGPDDLRRDLGYLSMRLPWDKLDVATWSWQKSLGGEGGHGVLAMSPRAVERLEATPPPWRSRTLFRLTSKGS